MFLETGDRSKVHRASERLRLVNAVPGVVDTIKDDDRVDHAKSHKPVPECRTLLMEAASASNSSAARAATTPAFVVRFRSVAGPQYIGVNVANEKGAKKKEKKAWPIKVYTPLGAAEKGDLELWDRVMDPPPELTRGGYCPQFWWKVPTTVEATVDPGQFYVGICATRPGVSTGGLVVLPLHC